jgi:tetratricopeptide (TPR) repeat protein
LIHEAAELQAAIAERNVVAFVGAGVSVAATAGNRYTTWAGLLESGVERARAVVGPDFFEAEAMLDDIASGDGQTLETVATRLAYLLGGPTSRNFARWMHDALGRVPLVNRDPLDALLALRLPVVTTNFDTLLEEAGGLGAVTWTAPGLFADVIAGKRLDLVAHLHGSWEEPASVLITRNDLDNLYHARLPGLMTNALAGRALLFVGYEAQDYGFARLLSLAHEAPARHYWLTTSPRLEQEWFRHERITPIVYGERYRDLTGFLRSLAPVGLPRRSGVFLPPKRSMIGRDGELDSLVGLLLGATAGRGIVALSGGAGMGKTTLAVATAHHPRVARRFGERRWFVDCGALGTADDLMRAIARQAGLRTAESDPRVMSTLRALFQEAPTLVILDGIEAVTELPAVRHLLSQLTRSTQASVLIVGRAIQEVANPASTLTLAPLTHDEARRLFIRAAGRSYDTPELDELIRIIGSSPLSVHLMAQVARSRPSDLRTLAAQWLSERRALTSYDDVVDRQHLGIALELTLSQLASDEPAMRLLRLLGSLPDDVSVDDLPSLLPGHWEPALAALSRSHLVDVDGGRARVHEAVRSYIRLMEPAADDLQRMIAHFLARARFAPADPTQRSAADASLRADARNIDRAIKMALDRPDPRDAVDATLKMALRAPDLPNVPLALREADHRAEQVGDVHARATLARALGDVTRVTGAFDIAREEYRRALALFRQCGDTVGEASSIERLGDVALRSGELQAASKRYVEAAELYRRVGDNVGAATSLASLGDVAFAHGKYDEASERYESALRTFTMSDHSRGAADCKRRLGDVAFARAQHDEAGYWYENALRSFRETADSVGETACLRRLADLTLVRAGDAAQGLAWHSPEVDRAAIPSRVFLAYAAEDRTTAQELGSALRARDIDVVLADWLRPGDDIVRTLLTSVRARDTVVVLLSPAATSASMGTELERVLRRRDVDIVPAVVADVELPERFRMHALVDLREIGASQVAELTARLARGSRLDVRSIGGEQFESMVLELLEREGFRVTLTPGGDYGIDAYVEADDGHEAGRFAVQIKASTVERASVASIAQLAEYVEANDSLAGAILVTNAQLTSIARATLNEFNLRQHTSTIRVIDGPSLREMLLQHPEVANRHQAAWYGGKEWLLR